VPSRRLPREWPEGSAELSRCEIEWVTGYRRSYFRVVAHAPGGKTGSRIGTSEAFRWLFKAAADWRDPAQVEAVRALRSALIADGWVEVAEGTAWYGRRFVWRGAGPAPERIGMGAGGGDDDAR
jgi:hypothetical protein